MTTRFSAVAVPLKRGGCVLAAASAAGAGSPHFGSGENDNPYEILGINPLDGFDQVKMAYNWRRKNAENSGDAAYLLKLERAYDTVMMEQLQNRKKGVAYGSVQEEADHTDQGRLNARGDTGGTVLPAAIAAIRMPAPVAPGARQVGGRFWALAESDEEEDDDGDGSGVTSDGYSLTTSDVICEAFNPGYSEEEVATIVEGVVPIDDPARQGLHPEENVEVVCRIVHRRTATSAIRPWKGPLPKIHFLQVIFRATVVIRSWSLLTPMEAREHLVTGSIRWEMVARDIFNRFG
ncbi:hypothetical protein VPH35_008115 [Triticum aestivum]